MTLDPVLEVPVGHRYELVATINHKGSNIKSGDYIAHLKTGDDQWVCCNDEIITRSSLQEANTADNYILLFKMIEVDPDSLQFDVPCSPVAVLGDGDQNNQSSVQSPHDGSDSGSNGELPDIPYTTQHRRSTQVEDNDNDLKEVMKMQLELEEILRNSQPAKSDLQGKRISLRV